LTEGLSPLKYQKHLVRKMRAGDDAQRQLAAGVIDPTGQLAAMVKDGENALGAFVKRHIGFAVSVAKVFYVEGCLTTDDLIQEGCIGLVEAAKRFDIHQGTQFSTYAVWWIRQRIYRAIADVGFTCKIPANMHLSMMKVRKIAASLYQENPGHEPSAHEIAEQMDAEPELIQFLIDSSAKSVSLDTPVGGDDKRIALHETIPSRLAQDPLTALQSQELTDKIGAAVDSLRAKQMRIIREYYGLGNGHELTYEEIGSRMHLTRERVRQIKMRALEKLKRPLARVLEIGSKGKAKTET
jgi:RNA polymerase primary sigma factor